MTNQFFIKSEDIIKSLQWRYATKKFDTTRTLSEEDLVTLLEALRLSPSSFGLQPWKFMVVTDPEIRKQLCEAAWNQKQIIESSHVIIICRLEKVAEDEIDDYIKSVSEINEKTIEQLQGYRKVMIDALKSQDQKEHIQWMDLQCYIALGFLMQTAALMKIDACPMEGFSKEKFDQILNLPKKGVRSSIVCPVGYRDPSDKYATQQKVRFSLDQVKLDI